MRSDTRGRSVKRLRHPPRTWRLNSLGSRTGRGETRRRNAKRVRHPRQIWRLNLRGSRTGGTRRHSVKCRPSRPNDMKTLARALAGQARGERRRMISTSLLPRWRLLAVQNSRHQHILQWLQLKKQKILVKAALQLWKQSHRQRRRSSRQLSSAVLRHCAKQGVILLRRWTAASTFERRRRRIEAQVQTRCATVKMRRSLQLWAAATRCL